MRYVLILFGFVLILSACHTNEKNELKWGIESEKKATFDEHLVLNATDTVLEKYELARVAELKSDYIQALKIFSELLNEPHNSSVYQTAFIARSRVLMQMKKYNQAMAVLQPLSENPNTLFECRKLAMCARVLVNLKRFDEAENLLKVAIDKSPLRPDTELFRAEALSALGYICFTQSKPLEAVRFFRSAAPLFEKNNQKKQARKCIEIADYINNL